MKGIHQVRVYNSRLSYRMVISRNITILRGDSATGKTTLIDMIQAYQINGKNSGITLECDKPCAVLTQLNWRQNLSLIHDCIVFIDEGSDFVTTTKFAEGVRNSDNYYVIATRSSLFNLPYSINEVYGIRNVAGNKYQETKRLYSEFYPLYDNVIQEITKPECAVIEDSNAGYQFFTAVFAQYQIPCISAKGKSNIYRTITDSPYNTILVIADGAAFGPEMERILSLRKAKNLIIYLPESFEWLILKSDLLKSKEIRTILNNPSDHIESSEYFSWERFFTDVLVNTTRGTKYQYSKLTLNPVYLGKHAEDMILKVVPDMKF